LPRRWLLAAFAAALVAGPATAGNFVFGDSGLSGSADLSVTAGARVRTDGRDVGLIGKTNLAGQQGFCDDKNGGMNCTTVAGNASYLALPGSNSINGDDGDLNYAKGALVNGMVKFSPRLQLTYGSFGLDLSALYFYDEVNSGFEEFHPNNSGNNGFQPEHSRRPSDAEQVVGSDFELLNAYASGSLPLFGERSLRFKIGNLVLNQGQSSFLVLNSLNDINPPDVNIANLPGADIKEIFRPVPLAVLESALTSDFTVQGFYQFKWEAAPLPPDGSYFSTADPLGPGGSYAELGFGKNREDPMDLVGVEGRLPGEASLISKAGRTDFRAPDHDPSKQGEYGFSANYFAQDLNNATFGVYYRNLHARLPTLSYIAAQQSCAATAGNAAAALLDCRGFTSVPGGLEPTPVDTARLFLEYPKDIHSVGANFSTSLGQVAWAGEVVYRANQPLQVDPIDVGFAALQPAFPQQTISLAVVDIPGNRVAAPDYLYTQFLKQTVQPGQVIHGYLRRPTLNYQTSFLFSGGASDNPFGATAITALMEFGAFQILDLPPLDQLQLAGPGTTSHHSAGVDGTGVPNAQQAATNPADRQNPTTQVKGYASALSYGARSLLVLEYDDVFAGVNLSPALAYFQDFGGTSPLPSGDFISGRKQAIAQLQFNYFDRLYGGVMHTWYFGGGEFNLLKDRGNVSAFVGYQF
jgi:hypothetical protein